MSRLICKCWYCLSTTKVPNDIELRVYTDNVWNQLLAIDTIKTWNIIIQLLNQAVNQLKNMTKAGSTKPSKIWDYSVGIT
jgi:hypothetical protein